MSKRSLLQFNLRTLLLAMFLVGVAIVVYRWPWEVEKWETPYQTGLAKSELGFDDCDVALEEGEWKTYFGWPRYQLPPLIPPFPEPPAELLRTTTYRRNWRGKPVKDGPEVTTRKDGVEIGRRWYEEGDLRHVELLHPGGEVLRSETYVSGVADGPFAFREAVRSLRGSYRQGKKSGLWNFEYVARGERITAQQSFANDLPHGEWRWLDADGTSLQSATFERGELIHWIGQPWRKELAAWQRRNTIDPATTQLMNSQLADVKFYDQSVSYQEDFLAVCQPISSVLPNMLLYSPQRRSGDGFSFFNYQELLRADKPSPQSAWDALLPFALKNSRLPVYRFGVLGFVPICEREVHWRDTTGVMQVRFAEGSPHQAAWEEAVESTSPRGLALDWFQELFAGTPIQVDGREFKPTSGRGEPRHLTSHRRSRRDTLGLVLYSHGYSCEQRGNELMILPREKD